MSPIYIAQCGLTQVETSVLATLPAFAANILRLLQSRAIQFFSSIKELKVLMKDKVTTEAGEDMVESDHDELGDEHESH